MMKVTIGLDGAAPVRPDYGMLKAALIAAQAATPTARASTGAAGAPPPIDPLAALETLFSDGSGGASIAGLLGNRFHPDAPDEDPSA